MSRLDVELMFQRTGWLPWLAALLVIASVVVEAFGTTRLRAVVDTRTRDVERVREASAAPRTVDEPEKPLIEQRLDAFRAMLGDKREMHRLLGLVFTAAEKHAITLAQAQYKLDFDRIGGFYTYQVTLPVRGTYPMLRHFVDATLQAVPCAALEDVDFKRDGIGMSSTEAKLRFVLYLKDKGP